MSQPRCNSYYNATINTETDYPELEGDIRVDVVIVGGGFTGVATAVELCEKGYKVAIVEANKIGWGATGRNGGQVTGSLSGDTAMIKQLRNKLGTDAEQFVWNMRWRGHEIIKTRVKKYAIECDLKYGHLHTAYKTSHINELQQTYDEACKHGMDSELELLTKEQLPEYINTPLYHGGLLNKRNMHLHSVNLCIGEARAAESLGALIFENSAVIDIDDGVLATVTTAKGKITANSVVLAGNAYHKLARKKLRGMLFPASLGNCATAQLTSEQAHDLIPKDVAVYDTRFVLDYYRLTADNRLMFGGGTNYSGRDSKNVANELRPALERTFPQLRGINIEYEWTGMAGIVLNRIPQLGKVSNNVFYCQGYSGHGVATSHIMGEIMANAIIGEQLEFNLFAEMSHLRIPLNEWFGNQALALGMMYYKVMENFR
ncbi:FAD dependent oxidoreductase [Shewanella piezotolerans WP3]|uniref:FAD dependent oxidoreductase n=1 Tax=Shewanella piezotolerans (strain WP3 / JCM 13877) TaxID=225849 RepID=B8CLF6_SHEPW|nr:FAD-binding oxidoreductase [Shewanella piezotolerans]ACJ28607.1 FAD dependent oxidoreductase [Shewanella piezotolerans WP3]